MVLDNTCSDDLSQDGMEVPCKLSFTMPSKEIKLLPCADFKEQVPY